MKQLLALFCFAFILVGCATPKGDLVNTDVSFYRYNSSAKQYYKQKTFLVYTENGDNSFLSYQVEDWNQWFNLNVDKENAATIIAIINKYLEWHAIASRDNDRINKEITKAVSLQKSDYKYSFSVVSDVENNILRIDQCPTRLFAQACQYDHPIMYIGTYDAGLLKQELQQFIQGKFQSINYEKYH